MKLFYALKNKRTYNRTLNSLLAVVLIAALTSEFYPPLKVASLIIGIASGLLALILFFATEEFEEETYQSENKSEDNELEKGDIVPLFYSPEAHLAKLSGSSLDRSIHRLRSLVLPSHAKQLELLDYARLVRFEGYRAQRMAAITSRGNFHKLQEGRLVEYQRRRDNQSVVVEESAEKTVVTVGHVTIVIAANDQVTVSAAREPAETPRIETPDLLARPRNLH